MKLIKKTIGIIAAPEFPTDVANHLKEQLPSILGESERFSDDITWEFDIMTDGITSVAEDSKALLNSVLNRQEDQKWDYTLCLTDVPVFFEEESLLTRIHVDHKTAFLSLPALGWSIKKRVTRIAVQIIEEMASKKSDTAAREETKEPTNIFLLTKIRKLQEVEDEELIIRYLLYPKTSGRFTILAGMTYDNRPWTIMPSLKSVFAIAFGSGAYGMIFPTLWQLSYEYSAFRLASLTILAIFSLTLWLINGHNLWETDSISGDKKYRILYNTTTVITLLLAISFFHIILILLYLLTAFILIEPQFYAEQLEITASPNFFNYLQTAWMTASVGTITGAVGVGLEDEENVRQSTYGYRQRERYKILEQEKERREEAEKENE